MFIAILISTAMPPKKKKKKKIPKWNERTWHEITWKVHTQHLLYSQIYPVSRKQICSQPYTNGKPDVIQHDITWSIDFMYISLVKSFKKNIHIYRFDPSDIIQSIQSRILQKSYRIFGHQTFLPLTTTISGIDPIMVALTIHVFCTRHKYVIANALIREYHRINNALLWHEILYLWIFAT